VSAVRLPLAGAGISLGVFNLGAFNLGAFRLCGPGPAVCPQWFANGARLMQRLSRRPAALAVVDAAPDSHPAIGRRCLRSDLEQRDIVMRLATRKARLVGPAGRHATGPVPVKRGRRFEFTQE
jgi:hypothetical protein